MLQPPSPHRQYRHEADRLRSGRHALWLLHADHLTIKTAKGEPVPWTVMAIMLLWYHPRLHGRNTASVVADSITWNA